MIINRSPSDHTLSSLHAIIVRQMADILLENNADLADLVVCRQVLAQANFGKPAIEALLERACQDARLDMVA